MLILDWNDKVSLQLAASALAANDVLLGTSDTVLGLLANATADGAARLDAIKERREKPYIVLVANIARVKELIAVDNFEQIKDLIELCWPGPVTIICRAKEGIPPYMCASNGTIALRVPCHDGLQAILQVVPALFSTSANISGQPVPQKLEDVDPVVMERVQGTLMEQYILPEIQPSTILDATSSTIRLIRQGVFPAEQLEFWYGQRFD